MKQRLAELFEQLGLVSANPKQYTPRVQQPKKTKADRLGIQLGGVYRLKTRGGFLVVQVVEFRRNTVVIQEVEDVRRFHANPAHLSEYQR